LAGQDVAARRFDVSAGARLHDNQIARVAQHQHMAVGERATAGTEAPLVPHDFARGNIHALKRAGAELSLPEQAVQKTVGANRRAPVVVKHTGGLKPERTGGERITRSCDLACAGSNPIACRAIDNVPGDNRRHGRGHRMFERITPQHGTGLGDYGNQAALGKENNLPNVGNGGGDRRGMGYLLTERLPNHVTVSFIERQERLSRAAAHDENKVAINQRRSGALPVNVAGGKLGNQVFRPDLMAGGGIEALQHKPGGQSVNLATVKRGSGTRAIAAIIARNTPVAAVIVFGDSHLGSPKLLAGVRIKCNTNLLFGALDLTIDQRERFAGGDRKGAEAIGQGTFPDLSRTFVGPGSEDLLGTRAVMAGPAKLGPVFGQGRL